MKLFLQKTVPYRFFLISAMGIAVMPGAFAAERAVAGADRVVLSVREDSLKFYGGVLTDDKDAPVAFATLKVRRSGYVAQSDEAGNFKLNGAKGDAVDVSFGKALLSTFVLGDEASLRFVISSRNPALQRTKPVRLLYGVAAQPHLTAASTQAVYTDDIARMNVTSLKNALVGQFAGLQTNQSSGQPGYDEVSFQVRGRSPLVLVDGVVRDITSFDLEEIESVTLLKDALATSMLGVRGSNGALLVTTRKGTPARQAISFTAQTGIQQPLGQAEPLNAYDYSRLYNEARINDGLAPVYTADDLQKYKDHSSPYTHPDVNWRDAVLRKNSRFDRYTLNIRGGNKYARYFVALEHLNLTGIMKTLDSNTYSTNTESKTYVIRSNVDINVTSKITTGINLLGRIWMVNEPGITSPQIVSGVMNTPQNAYPVLNPNGTFGGTNQYPNNLWMYTAGSGYRNLYKRDIVADMYLKRTLDEITPGLWIQGKVGYYSAVNQWITRQKSQLSYRMNISPTGDTSYQQYGTFTAMGNSPSISLTTRSVYTEGSLGYNRVFRDKHGVDVLVLVNNDTRTVDSDLPLTYIGGAARVAYNYKQKYVLEGTLGISGSNRYPPNGSYKIGTMPAVGLAWNLDREKFMDEVNFVSALKLYASYGRTGWDSPGYFSYIQRYFDGPNVFFGTSAGSVLSMVEQPLANVNITYEKAKKFNVGIQGSLFNNRLGFTGEVYDNKFYDLLMVKGKNPSMLGNTYPEENIGRYRYSGADISLAWSDKIKDFSYYIRMNGGMLNTVMQFNDEEFRPYPWMERTGRMIGQPFGYIADGLFQSDAEAKSSPTVQGYVAQAGDIKYKDINGDGVIDLFDIAPIGVQKPVITYGFSLGANWKGFDFSALLQGVANRDYNLNNNNFYYEFYSASGSLPGNAFKQHLGRWTPETAATATYPRLSVGTNVNNKVASSYWMRRGDYLRLKNLEIGYSIPASVMNRIKLSSARIFVGGMNLLTFSNLGDLDPEALYSAYPVQKMMNMGINIKL